MKVLGIVTEYNPFHNGHKYHIEKSKELTGADYVIAIMSGNFTQSGNIAIYDKFKRAKIATSLGVDLVIELPTIYANSSAEYFAKGAISILTKLNVVDSLCFGSETDNIDIIDGIANTLIKNEENIWNDIQIELKNGDSFADSRQKVLERYLNDDEMCIINTPNNILGLEYVKSIKKFNSSISPFLIKRKDSYFNETEINNTSSFTSATSIRTSIYNKEKITDISKYIPAETLEIVKKVIPMSNDKLFDVIKYKIISSDISYLKNIQEVTEGIENKFIESINASHTYTEFLQNIKSKRYQLSKIKRMMINILLNITKDDFSYAIESNVFYAHILSCSNKGKDLLSEISNNSNIDLITSINENILNSLNSDILKYLNIDILASNIYSILSNNPINSDYTNRL